ncbi:DUF3152 domain-containing protein [Streptomyces kanasensis]|uniref:DUF3152 domain-containing protein n=1 Tax=Streptomyces kanasensis TaxID=936756 RepID=UPI0036FD673E
MQPQGVQPQSPTSGQYGYGYPYDQGTPAHGTAAPCSTPRDARGGHPEQREPGGGWGTAPYAPQEQPVAAAQPRIAQAAPRVPGPRQEFVEAFDGPVPQEARPGDGGVGAGTGGGVGAAGERRRRGHRRDGAPAAGTAPAAAGPQTRADGGGAVTHDAPADGAGDARDAGREGAPGEDRRGGRSRTYTGIAAAAVTTVLAVVVAGQVAETRQDGRTGQAADTPDLRPGEDAASRSDQRPTPPLVVPSRPAVPVEPPTYDQLMARQFPLAPTLKGTGAFEAVPGADPAPGKGQKVRYRVDVEKGLGLDGKLFATAVQETLNDPRSWAHGGAMTFERISTGRPDFVVTLASPGTTGVWCAKSGLDTTIDNVSCDSASTDRVMINAYRWAQGAETFGPKAMLAYRQMLINHEIGHRLGHNHRTCQTPGAPAPVMQQQTKSLEIDGVKCRPNPWVHPGE